MSKKIIKSPTGSQLLIPIIFLISTLSINVYLFGNASLDGANQISLILSCAVASVIAIRNGNSWNSLVEGIIASIKSAKRSILILLMIGALTGSWVISGIVPSMVYYGLFILTPSYFLVAACIISGIVAISTGSSWTTIATIGIALLSIGKILDIHEGLVAGAIISGAYFGDKLSPMSDTTNLASAVAGTDLFTHIKYMLLTTSPAFVVTLLIYFVIGYSFDANKVTDITIYQDAIEEKFNITPLLFLVPLSVIAMIVKKVYPLPALFWGTLLGGLFAILFQIDLIFSIGYKSLIDSGNEHLISELSFMRGALFSYITLMDAFSREMIVTTSNAQINELLTTSGMAGMLNTVWLIICALAFGGAMDAGGFLKKATDMILSRVNSTSSLIVSTVGTCLFFNTTASDQYMSIVIPGKMFKRVYLKLGYKPEVLSRTIEDSGTVTSVLIPWNTCGATQSGVLGIATLVYAPFCFFNILSPITSVVSALLNIKIRRVKGDNNEESQS